MDGKLKFTDKDKAQVVEFLNFIATEARFKPNSDGVDTAFIIKYFKLLSFMQQTILPKIDANILEIIKVHKPSTESEQEQSGE